MRRKRYLTLMLTLLAVVAAGCTGRGDGGGEPLRVGTSLPLSGERAQLGLETRRGYEIWRDMVNGEGGLLGRPVEVVVRDNGSNEETVAADYEHLIGQDKPELLLGSQSSVLNLPASAVAERSKMLFVCPRAARRRCSAGAFTTCSSRSQRYAASPPRPVLQLPGCASVALRLPSGGGPAAADQHGDR